MTKSYLTEPVNPMSYDIAALNVSLMEFKRYADMKAMQIEIVLKGDGVRINVIKKTKAKTVRKRQIECDNSELRTLVPRFFAAMNEIESCSAFDGPF